MKKIVIMLAVGAALAAGGCSADGDTESVTVSEAPAASSSTPTGETEECLAAASDWLSLYDALDEASTLDDPTKDTTSKVVDDSEELVTEMKTSCTPSLADTAVGAHNNMLRVDATITACEFVEMCGSRVDDELDKTMEGVEAVRGMVG